MAKFLIIGDVHYRVEDESDCQLLIDRIRSMVDAGGVDRVVFLGDEFHNHSIVRTEALLFWRQALLSFSSESCPAWLLVGNHDRPGDASSGSHALLAFKDMAHVLVIDEPVTCGGTLWLPYYHDNQEFIRICQQFQGFSSLFCHQEFFGTDLNGGFYSKTGVDPAAIPQTQVLGGHIHTPQKFGKVWYPGAPRWLQAGDANQDRSIYLVVVDDETGAIVGTPEAIPSPCSHRWHLVDAETAPVDPDFKPGDRYSVDLVGSQAWIEARRPLWAGNAKVRAVRTDSQQVRVRESEGLAQALSRWVHGYKPAGGTSAQVLEEMVRARLG